MSVNLTDLLPADSPSGLTTYGEVTEVEPLTVQINGTAAADATEGFLTLSPYTPTVGDLVVLLKVGPTYVALGAIT